MHSWSFRHCWNEAGYNPFATFLSGSQGVTGKHELERIMIGYNCNGWGGWSKAEGSAGQLSIYKLLQTTNIALDGGLTPA